MVTVKQQWWLCAGVVIVVIATLTAFAGLDNPVFRLGVWIGTALSGFCFCMSIRPGMDERYAQSLTEQLAAQRSEFAALHVLRPPRDTPPTPLPVVQAPGAVQVWCEQSGYHEVRALVLISLSDRSIEPQLRRIYQNLPGPAPGSFNLWLRHIERSRESPLQLPAVAHLAYLGRHPTDICTGVGKEPLAANESGRVGCPDCQKRLKSSTTGKVRRHKAAPSAPVDHSEPEPERTRRLDLG